jgi:hypothetical protein
VRVIDVFVDELDLGALGFDGVRAPVRSWRNVVIQILGKQNALSTVFTSDEARHLNPRRKSSRIITQQAFSHSLHPLRKFGSEFSMDGSWRKAAFRARLL